jgi:hypothetical protein
MRRVLLVLAVAMLCGGGQAAAQAPPAVKSDNVEHLRTIDEPGTVSARFRDGLMYLSTLRGLAIYDVRDPERPERLSFLGLPHFENEDVDLGGDVLLISNDPNEGKGRLYVIDIADPRRPRIAGELDTGWIDAGQGILLGFLGLEGANPLAPGTGHTASCIDDCRYAYLAGSPSGIDVVDLTDPADPRRVKNLPLRQVSGGVAIHDVQVDEEGIAWLAGYGGTFGFDVSDPLNPVQLFQTGAEARSRYIDEPINDGSTQNDYIHHNSMRLGEDLVLVTEEDYTRPGCDGAGALHSYRINPGGDLVNLDSWAVEPNRTKGIAFCSAHYFDVRDDLVAQGFYEQGVRFVDVSDPENLRQVGFWVPRVTEMFGALYPPTDPTGQIVYGLDLVRGIDVLRIDRARTAETVVAPEFRRTRAEQVRLRRDGTRFAGLCRILPPPAALSATR